MKRIGKILFLWFLSSTLMSVDKSIHLYIQDMEQNPVRQVEKGVPFLLQIVVDNMQGVQQPAHVVGFEHFDVSHHGSAQSTNIINGQRTDRTTFNYMLRAKDIGTFVLGPISIRAVNGDVITSENIHVIVGEKTIVSSVKKQPFFLEAQIDKKTVYVGEELILRIRFYFALAFEKLKITDPQIENGVVGDITQDPAVGREMVRDAEYRYREWIMKVYPEKAGQLTIPSMQAMFHVATDFSQGLTGIFDIFGMSSEKIVQSAVRSVDVIPLPESKTYKDVSAVGQFDRVEFALQQKNGAVGEGIVGTYTIVGNGNFVTMKAPQIQLPAGLKYYESNSSVQKFSSGKQEKTFEYIIQAEQPGEFEIPSQKFVYFDAVEKKYKQMQTNETDLKIEGDALVVEKEDVLKKEDIVQDNVSKFIFREDQINYVLGSTLESIDTNSGKQKILFWIIFLLIALLCFIALYECYRFYVDIAWHETYWGYYLLVQWQLWHIRRKQNLSELYSLFQHVCAHYHIELHEQDLVELFKKANISDEKVLEWKNFMQKLAKAVFSKQQDMVKDKQHILEQGQYWMKELLRVCKNISQNHKKNEQSDTVS